MLSARTTRRRSEDKAREILRRAYRHAWNLPHVRETLASCPHFMLCGEGDVYPKFLTNKDLGDERRRLCY